MYFFEPSMETFGYSDGETGWVSDVVDVVMNNLEWWGTTLQAGSAGTSNVHRSLVNPDAEWIGAGHGWLYDMTSGNYGYDRNGDGMFDYAGRWDGCVFSLYDGFTWKAHDLSSCGDGLPSEKKTGS